MDRRADGWRLNDSDTGARIIGLSSPDEDVDTQRLVSNLAEVARHYAARIRALATSGEGDV